MIAAASLSAVAGALSRARTVAFSTYLLRPGAIFDALESACRRGAKVTVRVERTPYRNDYGSRENAREAAALRAAGGDVRVVDDLHLKAAVIDGVAYLDDRNWTSGDDVVVRDDARGDVRVLGDAIAGEPEGPPSSTLAAFKDEALAMEATMLDGAPPNADVRVETEAFGTDPVLFPALERLARGGRRVRLLVCSRELARERGAIARLQSLGVDVRSSPATHKFALAAGRAWIGSANATFSRRGERDWGVLTSDARLRTSLQAQFDARWSHARAVEPRAK